MSTQQLITLIGASVGGVVALGTLVVASLEYRRAGRMKRAKLFFELRQRLREERLGGIAILVDLATNDDPIAREARTKLEKLPLQEKRDYVNLFEEVSLMLEWRLIKRRVAHYMFGYYAIRCWESKAFWSGNINKWTPYRVRFHKFYAEMKKQEKRSQALTRVTGRSTWQRTRRRRSTNH